MNDADHNSLTGVTPHGVPDELPRLLTSAEVAATFRCTERTLRRWAAAGRLVPVRIGGTLRFHADDVRTLLDRDLIATIPHFGRQCCPADPADDLDQQHVITQCNS